MNAKPNSELLYKFIPAHADEPPAGIDYTPDHETAAQINAGIAAHKERQASVPPSRAQQLRAIKAKYQDALERGETMFIVEAEDLALMLKALP